MAQKIRWASNKGAIADRAYIIGRVINGEIYLMPEMKTGNFSKIELVPEPAQEPENHAPIGGDVKSNLIVEPRK